MLYILAYFINILSIYYKGNMIFMKKELIPIMEKQLFCLIQLFLIELKLFK